MPKRHRARLFSATAKSTVAKTQKLVTKITFGKVIFSVLLPMIAFRSDNNCLVFIESILFPYMLIYYSFISKQIDLVVKESLEI